MTSNLKWWRAKPPYLLSASVNWFERSKAYPGRELERPKMRGTVRVFRDSDAFDKENVNFGLEVHPTEIAFDIASARRALEAVKNHKRFGFNYDPSHLGYQGVDYVKFIRTFANRIYHVHMKDVWWGHGDGTVGVFGGHVNFADPRRYWDFRSLGHGDINFEEIIVALNDIGYQGPLSVEWEDSRMDREHGATEAAAFVKRIDFKPSAIAFDAQFDR